MLSLLLATVFSLSAPPDTLRAEYPGGTNALEAHFAKTLVYPKAWCDSGRLGKANIGLRISSKGIVDSLWVISSNNRSLGAEALASCQKLGVWKPAKLKGKPVVDILVLKVAFNPATNERPVEYEDHAYQRFAASPASPAEGNEALREAIKSAQIKAGKKQPEQLFLKFQLSATGEVLAVTSLTKDKAAQVEAIAERLKKVEFKPATKCGESVAKYFTFTYNP
jgi:hypothetical protein